MKIFKMSFNYFLYSYYNIGVGKKQTQNKFQEEKKNEED